MKRLSRSKRVFALVFACLFAVTLLGVSILGTQLVSNRRAAYNESLQRESEKTLNYFSQCLTTNQSICMSVFNATWYHHYRNHVNAYAQEFDALKKIEIANSVQSLVAAMHFTDDMMIITPAKNTIIRCGCWYTMDLHRFVYPRIEIDTSAGLTEYPKVTSNDDNICVLSFRDSTQRYHKTIISLLLDKRQFQNSLRRMMPEGCVYAHATIDGSDLGTIGAAGEQTQVSLSSNKFSITLGFPTFEQAEMPSILTLLGLVMLSMLFLDTAVSLLAMRIITHPVAKMVLKTGGEKEDLDHPFHFLQNYMDTLTSQLDSLSAENRSLQLSRTRFLSMMHNEIYFAMLVNPAFNFEDEYIRSVIPELSSGKACVLALLSPKYPLIAQESLPLEADFEQLAERFKAIKINQERYLFLFCDAEQMDDCAYAVGEKLKAYRSMLYTVMTCVNAPAEFYSAYLYLRRGLEQQRKLWLELPVSTENAVINLLRANHAEKCCEYLRTLRGHYSPDAIVRLFGRMSEEWSCSLEEQLGRYHYAVQVMNVDDQWNALEECVRSLCAGMNAAQRKAVASPSGESICQFIRDHFTDPELSVVLLAERFQMHRTQISKIIKQETGLTFSELVQQLRLDAANVLLREGSLSAAAVSEQVGYASYATFKRAFVRTYGTTPREFAQGEADGGEE